jgi:hypothetical protein
MLLFWCTTVERGVVFSLVIFLLLILLFLSIYPVSLSRNILVHCVVYTVFLSRHQHDDLDSRRARC